MSPVSDAGAKYVIPGKKGLIKVEIEIGNCNTQLKIQN